jgi:class 3 adenylate cyclase
MARLRETFDKRLRDTGTIAGYFAGMSPEDLILGEALLNSGWVAHLVLPYSRALCRLSFCESWRESFDWILSRATSVTDDVQRNLQNDQVNMRFAALRAYGSAWLRAQRLDSNLLLWGLNSTTEGASDQPSGFLSQQWANLGVKWEAFTAASSDADLVRGKPAPMAGSGESKPPAPYDIRAMLFADVRGYSRLDDPGLIQFAQVFMPRVSQLLDTFASRILSRRTAGDGIFLVFSDIGAAAEIAFALRNMVAKTDWESLGLPPRLGIRISLDAGPVYLFEDPIVHRPEVCGAFVNRAARVEPVTPPNEVYASETFSALYVAGGARRFRFDYVGQTELPKGFGLTPLYCLAEAEA